MSTKSIDSRSEMLLGEENLKRLRSKTVAVFGLGGVGGYACESLARTGIGHLHLVDNDLIDISNINRQIIATRKNIGNKKIDETEKRISNIRSDVKVTKSESFILKDNVEKSLDGISVDYIVDCIDTVTGKLGIIKYANDNNIPVISAMGTGNKLCPEMLEIDDIYNTSKCPLCKVMRRELRNLGIENLKVVYSKETPRNASGHTPGSLTFVPGACGLIIGSVIIRDLLNGFI